MELEFEIKQEDVYHECRICDERFPTYSGLEIHSKIHCSSLDAIQSTELNRNGENSFKSSPDQVSVIIGTAVATQIIKEEPKEVTIGKCESNGNFDVKQVHHHKDPHEININGDKNYVETLAKVFPLPKISPEQKTDTSK
ncbi:hypothetical protein LOTGIDRAFT_172250, partial [Lottia gigantea]